MKKLLVLTMVFTLGVMVPGCGAKSAKEETPELTVTPAVTAPAEETAEETPEEIIAPSFDDVDLSGIVKLAKYKGMDLEKTITEVTKEAVDAEIKSALENGPVEDEKGVIAEGDTANFDYEGKIDGVAFEGGTEEGRDLKIGSGGFIPGFEEQMIGMKKGDTKDLEVTFPDEYSEELAGKDAVFTVKVNAVKKALEAPTDEWVAANTEYKTVDEYKAGVEKSLKEYNDQTAEGELANQAMMKLFDESEVSEYPENALEYGEKLYEQNVQQYADYSGQTIQEFVESQGMTMDQYEQEKEESSKGIAKQVLVMNAVIQAEGMKIGDDKYKTTLAQILEEYQMDEATLVETYGQDNIEQNVLMRCVQDLILENAKVKEVKAEDVAPAEEEIAVPVE